MSGNEEKPLVAEQTHTNLFTIETDEVGFSYLREGLLLVLHDRKQTLQSLLVEPVDEPWLEDARYLVNELEALKDAYLELTRLVAHNV